MAKRGPGGGEQVRQLNEEAEKQVDGFLAKYTPEIEKIARACRKKMRARLAGATELVYDNYNALAIGFGPSEKAGEAIFSLALYPRWVSLFFLQGAKLHDPSGLLKGGGTKVKHIVLQGPADLDRPEIRDLMDRALIDAKKPLDPKAEWKLVVRSVAAAQRSRRPGETP